MTTQPSIDAAQSLHQAGRLEEAAALYDQCLADPSIKADAHYGLGTVFLQQNDFDQAIHHLSHAINLESSVPEFEFNLGLAYRSSNKPNAAKASFEKTARLAYNNPTILEAACNALGDLGQIDLALKLLHQQAQLNLSSLQLIAKLELSRKHYSSALPVVQEIARRHPDQASSHYDVAQVAARLRNFSLAIQTYDQFLELSNGGEIVHQLGKVDLLLQARRGDEALALYQGLAESVPESSQFLLLAARCNILQGQPDSAVDYLLRALALDSLNGHAWQSIVEVCKPEQLPELITRAESLKIAMKESPDQAILIQFAQARAHHRLEQIDQAFNLYRQANYIQQKQLKRLGKAYDVKKTEDQYKQIQELFAAVEYPQKQGSQDGVIFVTGMPRSGTSLIEKILGGLETTKMGGELESLEAIATQYYWQVNQGIKTPVQNLAPAEWAAMGESYHQQSWTRVRGQRLIDKMPHNFRHLGLITKILPSSVLIYVERSPLDVCWSIYTKPFPDDHGYACDFEDLAHYYSLHQKLMAFWQDRLGDRLITIQYEQLVEDAAAVMKSVVEECELVWNDRCLEMTDRLSTAFTFSELQIRQPISNSAIGKWRKYEAQLGPLLNAMKRNGVVLKRSGSAPK